MNALYVNEAQNKPCVGIAGFMPSGQKDGALVSFRFQLPLLDGWTDTSPAKYDIGISVSQFCDDMTRDFEHATLDGWIEVQEPTMEEPGDLDSDGEVTVADAVALIRLVTEQQPDSSIDVRAADFNNDGIVDMLDVRDLLKALA